ncbi:MAG: aminopeptidase, partial [Paramuribaculum sp.]|nr:aminopeptidase [Paramuribaculum sp.]
MKKTLCMAMAILALTVTAQTRDSKGGITTEMMSSIKSAYKNTAADKAIFNASSNNAIKKLAVNTV